MIPLEHPSFLYIQNCSVHLLQSFRWLSANKVIILLVKVHVYVFVLSEIRGDRRHKKTNLMYWLLFIPWIYEVSDSHCLSFENKKSVSCHIRMEIMESLYKWKLGRKRRLSKALIGSILLSELSNNWEEITSDEFLWVYVHTYYFWCTSGSCSFCNLAKFKFKW